jgi:hypothetical protein
MDEVCRSITMWIWFFQNMMVFEPIALIAGIKIFVRWVTSEEVHKERSILESLRMLF